MDADDNTRKKSKAMCIRRIEAVIYSASMRHNGFCILLLIPG
jgi:hypothetical protein